MAYCAGIFDDQELRLSVQSGKWLPSEIVEIFAQSLFQLSPWMNRKKYIFFLASLKRHDTNKFKNYTVILFFAMPCVANFKLN